MYRVIILFFLAIASACFALDTSSNILYARSISDVGSSVSWGKIEWATKYKLFYDESALLSKEVPEPLFDTDFINTNEFGMKDLTPWTEYTLIVRWYNALWKEIGKTLPLHIKTYRTVPFNIVWEPRTTNDHTIEIQFAHPINPQKSQFSLTEVGSKKVKTISKVSTHNEDMRNVIITIKGKFDPKKVYELGLKKVISTSGDDISAENKIPLRISYAAPMPDSVSVLGDPLVDNASSSDEKYDTPVPIDHLPQTWPAQILLIISFSVIGAFIIQKRSRKRA